jgi:arsenate reductase
MFSIFRYLPSHSHSDDEAMNSRTYNVLFLCTGNSARSILAESIMNHWGKGQFKGLSAGSDPKGEVNPLAIDLLKQLDFPIGGPRSKSWDEFATAGGPHLDFVITVCDNAAREVCPYWPGQPMTAHWGIPDPASVEDTEMEKKLAFRQAFKSMETRIKLFLSLPIASIDKMRLQERMDAIGKTPPRAPQQ